MYPKIRKVPPGSGYRYSLAPAPSSGELRHAALSLSQKKTPLLICKGSIKKLFVFIFCRQKGSYTMGIWASDEIKQERIAGVMGERFDEIRFPKWLFAAHKIKYEQYHKATKLNC